MRAFILAFAAAAAAQSTILETLPVTTDNGSSTLTTTLTYSNAATSYLTETNSLGVVTGEPTPASQSGSQPAAITTQPAVATIPAGLPSGEDTIYLNVSASLTSFTVSIGSSTTDVIGGGGVVTTGAVTTGGTAGVQQASTASGASGTGASGTGSGSGGSVTTNGGSSSTASSSASASSSHSAAAPSNLKLISAGLVGLGALVAALS